MSTGNGVFVGIDLLAARKSFTHVVLDSERHLLALGQGRLKDVLAFLAGQRACTVAVNAPRQAGFDAMRAEALQQMGIPAPLFADDKAAAPAWMRRGYDLYAQIGEMGYLPCLDDEAQRNVLETDGEAAFWNVLGHQPYPARALEGRLQRQFVLRQRGLKVLDPMDFLEEVTPRKLLQNLLPLEQIYNPFELNAWMAALTAWLAVNRPNETVCLGMEGNLLVLPARAV